MGLVERIQSSYEDNRAPETWGSPSGSTEFFYNWSNNGLTYALRKFVRDHEDLGPQDFHPAVKAGMALVGATILATGVGSAVNRDTKHTKALIPVYSGAIALLVTSGWGGSVEVYGSVEPGVPLSEAKDDMIMSGTFTNAEARKVHKKYGNRCAAEAFNEEFPGRMSPVSRE